MYDFFIAEGNDPDEAIAVWMLANERQASEKKDFRRLPILQEEKLVRLRNDTKWTRLAFQ